MVLGVPADRAALAVQVEWVVLEVLAVSEVLAVREIVRHSYRPAAEVPGSTTRHIAAARRIRTGLPQTDLAARLAETR